MNAKLSSLAFAALILSACAPKPPETEATSSPTPPKTTSTPPPSPSTAPATASKENPASSLLTPAKEPPAKIASRSTLPAALKSAAYDYYGLGNEKPVNMEVVRSDQSGVVTGSQAMVLNEVQDGQATFTWERTGGLATEFGTQKVSLNKDGVFLTQHMSQTLDKPQMEMPADPTPGRTWNTSLKLAQGGNTVSIDATYKVTGLQNIRTKAGPRRALLIESTGKADLAGQKATVISKEWYVKGVGIVKGELTTVGKDGKKRTVTIQETN
jgi:hypothetical protein